MTTAATTDLAEVLAALDSVTPGEWSVDECLGDLGISCHGAAKDPRLEYWIVERVHGDSRKTPKQPTPANNANGIVAAVNYLRANRERLLKAEADSMVLDALRERVTADATGVYQAIPNLPITAETMDAATDAFARFCVDFGDFIRDTTPPGTGAGS